MSGSFSYNRRAFGQQVTGPLLFELYLKLVAVELALKARVPAGQWGPHGHRLAGLVKACTTDPAGLSDAGPYNAAMNVESALGGLSCADREGNPAPVNPHRYPDLRYLRHDSDFSGGTTDAHLSQAVAAATALWLELDRFWKQAGGPGVLP